MEKLSTEVFLWDFNVRIRWQRPPSLLTFARLAARAPEVQWAPVKGDTRHRGLSPLPTAPLTLPSPCQLPHRPICQRPAPWAPTPPHVQVMVSLWVSFPATDPQCPLNSPFCYFLSAAQILVSLSAIPNSLFAMCNPDTLLVLASKKQQEEKKARTC